MLTNEEVQKRLDRYVEEKKRVTANRSWEAGYILGWMDALKWILDENRDS